MSRPVIAIDGPAGSGKSTVARLVAERLGWHYINTGACYRAVTNELLREEVDLDNEREVLRAARSLDITVRGDGGVCVGGARLAAELESRKVEAVVSRVAMQRGVRALVNRAVRRSLLQKGTPSGVVMEGRDTATALSPDAALKVYLTASDKERAARRARERGARDEETAAQLWARDRVDSTRETSPLTPAPDSQLIDTTNLTPQLVAKEILLQLRRRRPTARTSPMVRWVKFMLGWLLGRVIHLKSINFSNIPATGPAVLAPSHCSNWDPPLIGYACPREVFFLAKVDIFGVVGIYTWLISKFNALPVSSSAARGAIRTAQRLLAKGRLLVIFPEGTRNMVVERPFLPFQPGAAYIAQAANVLLVPAYIERNRGKWKLLKWSLSRKGPAVRFGPPIDPLDYPPGRRGVVQMTRELRRRVGALAGEGEGAA